ncbi:MAG: secondary thiamine-phosphate synthase enzyme [Omnitrophica WOR_2 bacterium SM23_72]|nr:MAG: secondary thiamine-phosphate synthase enzyme [Omnitrophica WOR_2 bacterium SM23_72]
MKIIHEQLRYNTKGSPQLLNITADLSRLLASSKLRQGSLTVFVVGSTAGITTFEYEPGLIQDVADLYEKMIPSSKHYHHDETWGDANGYSHLRAALTGPSLTVPFEEGRLLLGTWQQIVLAEFDNRPRQRHLIVQIMGE